MAMEKVSLHQCELQQVVSTPLFQELAWPSWSLAGRHLKVKVPEGVLKGRVEAQRKRKVLNHAGVTRSKAYMREGYGLNYGLLKIR